MNIYKKQQTNTNKTTHLGGLGLVVFEGSHALALMTAMTTDYFVTTTTTTTAAAAVAARAVVAVLVARTTAGL